jgi:hypothetical protein
MSRKARSDPTFIMMYIVDPWILFEFNSFKKLFVEQFIPTAIDSYWKEDLNLYQGDLGCMWSVNFNPSLLGYVTTAKFRFFSPISAERDCSQIVYILPDMEKDDLEEVFISCMPSILGEGRPFIVRFHGYSADPRPIWEIERVIEQAIWIVEVGGISALEVFPTGFSQKSNKMDKAFPGVGAFEIWLISKRLMSSAQGKTLEKISSIFEQFKGELLISNSNLEKRATDSEDW